MKNVLFINNRTLNLYDFKEIRKINDLRISAVVSENIYKDLSDNVKNYLEKIYILPNTISNQKFTFFQEDQLYSIVEKELFKFNNTRIVTSDELSVLVAASLREKYNLPGTSYSIILNYKDKVQQKETLAKSGIHIPKFLSVEKEFNNENKKLIYQKLSKNLNTPFILKPADMGGTIGVEKIENYDDFCKYLIEFDYFHHFIAEEFIDAPLYHCDFIIQDGEYIFSEVSEYLHNGGLSFIKGSNHGSLLLSPEHPLRLPIIDFCKKANSILGLKSGCGHFEVFVMNNKEPIFLEAAARPAGSVVPLVLTKTFKRNYMNAALLAEIGENPGTFNTPSEYYFWTFFPKKRGIIKSFNPIRIQSSYEIEWLVRTGDRIEQPHSIAEKSGILLAKNTNYGILREDFDFLRNFESINTEPI